MLSKTNQLFRILCASLVVLAAGCGGGGTPQDTVYYVHSDHLNTPAVVTNKDKQVVWEGHSMPFGETSVTVSTITQPLRLPGQYFDQESGLNYNIMRTYDPKTGRYLEVDHLGLFDGPSLYGYAHQNPVSNTDPTGEFLPFLLAALFWGGLDIGMQVWDNNGNWDCVDYWDAAFSGLLGGFGGGLIGKSFVKGVGKEWSHWVPDRFVRQFTPSGKINKYYKSWVDNYFGGFVRSGFNGNYVSTSFHALTDPFRFQFMNRSWKAANPMFDQYIQQVLRIPGWMPGSMLTGGAGYESMTTDESSDCNCN